jgi:hypothetical protein
MATWLVFLLLCVGFYGILRLADNALGEALAPRKRAKRLQKSQTQALRNAEDWIVFDQTLTREKLVRDWKELGL